jgi:hypothetical protein
MNNTTIIAADGRTHLKILATSLVASIATIAIVMMAHAVPADDVRLVGTAPGPPVKPGLTYLTSRSDTAALR